jgi:membrane fusion protein (multidrug efflux system)
VVQRVPVRIQIDDADLAKSPLRVGLSATVTVDTTRRDGPVLAVEPEDRPVGDTQVYSQDLDKADTEADAIVKRNLGGGQE